MEVDPVARVHAEKWMRVDPEQHVAHGDLAVISIAHEDSLFDRAFQHVVRYLRLLLDDLDVLRTDREERGLTLDQSGRRNKGENSPLSFDLARLGVSAQLEHPPFDEIRQTEKRRGKSSLGP